MTDNTKLINSKVLVLGAGGLGCEILKNLAMVGFPNIHVVDMDTIELTNLNRQFLFREQDIGKPKATVAAQYINNLKLPSAEHGSDVQVVPHVGDLTKLPIDFWKQFTAVICGLDAVEPRRYASWLLVRLTYESNFEVCIPLIDGGSEGFSGHCRTIIPGINACYECTIGTLPPPDQSYPLCTIANNPRLPEHVVTYVLTVQWPESELHNRNYSLDSPEALAWLVARCEEHASKFGIDPTTLTEKFILGVAKNVVPSVITTNVIIAALCCTELLKLVLDLADDIENAPNFMLYNGNDGCFAYSFKHDKLPDCSVCRYAKKSEESLID
ncbi:HBL141Wp [Eremothecium sinecaudum]|uniref:NEDD8-activating enzyme E1 catalytic subunit n=1 Tax=Eremothecium sinecaudum TaxID=45286 RepID=A0A109UWB2_9SACH|nr:HBL141Wp [Eremothecium sinecaudum]AMD18761.1 HBL141Wp [Eremothecium sinecaudum]